MTCINHNSRGYGIANYQNTVKQSTTPQQKAATSTTFPTQSSVLTQPTVQNSTTALIQQLLALLQQLQQQNQNTKTNTGNTSSTGTSNTGSTTSGSATSGSTTSGSTTSGSTTTGSTTTGSTNNVVAGGITVATGSDSPKISVSTPHTASCQCSICSGSSTSSTTSGSTNSNAATTGNPHPASCQCSICTGDAGAENRIEGGKGKDILTGTTGNDTILGRKGADTLNGGAGDDILRGGRGADTLTGGNGNDQLFGGRGKDLFIHQLQPNHTHTHDAASADFHHTLSIDGGRGEDSVILVGKPIDYRYEMNQDGALVATHWDAHQAITIKDVENIRFDSVSDTYTAEKLANDPFITDRRNISIYGDNTNNRLLAMNLEQMELIQEIPVPGAENVYSVDYVTADKGYITPRESNFVQLLNRDEAGRFELGKKIDLDFNPRTPNRNDNNGLVLYSGSDKPMWALIDANTDTLVAQGGRNEITRGTFENYDSSWATGHAQWISDNQFLLPDREAKEIELYSVNQKSDGSWDVQMDDSIVLPGSVHTFFGTATKDNGDITTFAPGEGSNAKNNEDANLYELKISGSDLSLSRQVNVTGGLHHPESHPNGEVIYAPTSNGTVDVIDRESFEVIKTINAGLGAGHVTWVADRNLALINNHQDTFVTAVDMTTHEVIKNIPVTTDNPDVDNALQAHTARVGKDGRYYYNFATDQGTFFRIDLETLEMDKSVFTGGTPKQASQPGELGHGH